MDRVRQYIPLAAPSLLKRRSTRLINGCFGDVRASMDLFLRMCLMAGFSSGVFGIMADRKGGNLSGGGLILTGMSLLMVAGYSILAHRLSIKTKSLVEKVEKDLQPGNRQTLGLNRPIRFFAGTHKRRMKTLMAAALVPALVVLMADAKWKEYLYKQAVVTINK